jgi:hypothetical protein
VRISHALELANEDDVARMPDDFTKRYMARMLALRDQGERPADVYQSILRNQGISGQVCYEIADERATKLICADAMVKMASIVLSGRYGEHLQKIVVPAMAVLGRTHIGGSVYSIPVSLLLGCVLVAILAFTVPWLAVWGVAILVLHLSLIVILAMFLGPFGAYLITGEPVLLAALAVLLTCVLRQSCRTAESLWSAAKTSKVAAKGG